MEIVNKLLTMLALSLPLFAKDNIKKIVKDKDLNNLIDKAGK